MGRSIGEMSPELYEKYVEFLTKVMQTKINFIITSISRPLEEQLALYCKGRMKPSLVDFVFGLAAIPRPSNYNIVTWTLKSKHLVEGSLVLFNKIANIAKDNGVVTQQQLNEMLEYVGGRNKSRAFDIAIIGDNRMPTWDVKADVNADGIPDYVELGKIGESVGLVWGGSWKKKDYPHFEV